MTEKCNALDY